MALLAERDAWHGHYGKALSKAEAIKQERRQLRGNLALDLADATAPFETDAYSLLKFHGVYQGYDRDRATERKQQR
jgi:sulfite reductase (ferredoxin)